MKKDRKSDINTRIARFRAMAGLTQAQAAQALGMNRSTYSRMENHGNPGPEKLKQLAALFQVTTDQILYGKPTYDLGHKLDDVHVSSVNEKPLPTLEEPHPEEPIPFVPTAKEINLLKMLRNMPGDLKAEIMQFIDDKNKEFWDKEDS